jgi:hypothetical protein
MYLQFHSPKIIAAVLHTNAWLTHCMPCAHHYLNRKLATYHDYYHGRKQAPVMTIFIGGNHEASNYLQVSTRVHSLSSHTWNVA